MKQHLLIAALLIGSASSWAQQQATAPTGASAQAAAAFTEGEVRKVDKSAGKITLKHGEIRNLEMPPMTMVFSVSDPAMLEQVKAGDRIRFRALDRQGQLTVTEIQPAS